MGREEVNPLVVYHLSKIYVIGGSRDGISLTSTEIFDPLMKQWAIGPELDKAAARIIGGVLDCKE